MKNCFFFPESKVNSVLIRRVRDTTKQIRRFIRECNHNRCVVKHQTGFVGGGSPLIYFLEIDEKD
jgi:hypothetical protein